MVRVRFHDLDGRPLAGAVIAIAAAPVEVTDIGMVADGDGVIELAVSHPGRYEFSVHDGTFVRRAVADLAPTTMRVDLTTS